ncbi:MAG: amidase [Desulfobacterales bacterium]|nr:MAG: amidase [Desulfobacterales bacterium]
MGGFKEYDQYDGLGLAELVKKKEISSAEICEEAIIRIEKVNPQLNAVVTPMYELAREMVQRPLSNGPFTGVPFLLKDLLGDVAGVRQTRGSKAFKNYVSIEDSELVKRYKQAGLVILGKTNCPEFGLLGITEPELHGPTRNPWNIEHTPGGSSGGSAAAVASRMVALASGGDGGGSIRIPASCCGLFGLKVTRGRNPTGPLHGVIWQGAVVEHVISRSIRDSAAILGATQGADVGAPYIICPPAKPYVEEIEQSPDRLKIAFNTRSPIDTPVHPDCVRAVEHTAKLLEKLGHDVEEAHPDIDGQVLAKSFLTMYFGEIAADIDELESVLGRKAKPSDVEDLTWTLALLGRAYSAGYFVKMMREWDIAARVMGRFHKTYDIYLTPTVAHPPVKIGELQPKPAEKALIKIVNTFGLGGLLKVSGITDKLAVESLSKTPFTQLANFTGQPAMSVPLYWTSDGLPCGSQFIGRFGDEATLLRLAAQLEKAQPWSDKRPPVCA